MENGETWRWVFTTPGDMPQPQIVAKAEGEKPQGEKPEAAPSAPPPEQAAAPAAGGQP
jgi:general secretion pathway protein J